MMLTAVRHLVNSYNKKNKIIGKKLTLYGHILLYSKKPFFLNFL